MGRWWKISSQQIFIYKCSPGPLLWFPYFWLSRSIFSHAGKRQDRMRQLGWSDTTPGFPVNTFYAFGRIAPINLRMACWYGSLLRHFPPTAAVCDYVPGFITYRPSRSRCRFYISLQKKCLCFIWRRKRNEGIAVVGRMGSIASQYSIAFVG